MSDPVTQVARDLTAIIDLTASLIDEAVHKADDHDLPGGVAMVALGPVASPEAWENMYEAGEHLGRDVTHVLDEIENEAPVLQTLLFWSEAWRVEHNWQTDQRPTIVSEASFIRHCLDWAWGNEVHFEDFARDMGDARRGLENLLHAGQRHQRTRVLCANPECERQPRLIRLFTDEESRDFYKCPACKWHYDEDAFKRAYARQLRSGEVERYVKAYDAIGTLRAQGRSERAVRQWLDKCLVKGYCDVTTHEVWYWWPDLWRLHLTALAKKTRAA